nr:isovaleryl-CoA dehydrogenase, mitochondrial [Tanacetum cinerariifolium]
TFKEGLQQFAHEKIAPHAEKIDKMDSFPQELNLWKLMGDFNLHGLTAPASSYSCNAAYWNMLMLAICIIVFVWLWRRLAVHQHQLAFPTVSILTPALIN